MNFNQMDLIKFKELLQVRGKINETQFDTITLFISKLLNLHTYSELVLKDVFGETFVAKQKLINAAGAFINSIGEN